MFPLAFDTKTDDRVGTTLFKALAFFGCVAGFDWVLVGPLRAHYADPVNKALTPFVGQYIGYLVLRTVVTCAFLLLLNWIFLSLVERRRLADLGFSSSSRSPFWQGTLIGFLPGLILAVPLVVTGFAEAYSSPKHLLVSIPWALLGAFNLLLEACGYGLQVLWRRFGGIIAGLVMALSTNLLFAVVHPRQLTISDLSLRLASEVLLYLLMCLAFSVGKSSWLPLGLAVGLSLSPQGGGASISWSYEKAHELWTSTFWSFQVGILRLAILAAVGLLIWFLNSEKIVAERKKLTDFYASSWAVGCGLSFLLILQWAQKLFAKPNPENLAQNSDLLVSASLLSFYGCGIFCLWLYKSWSEIQDSSTRTRPGQAVGFLLVPVYNLYWGFRAIPGFANEFNLYVKRHDLGLSPLSSGLYTAYAVLCLVSIVPFLGVAALPVAYIVGMVMIRRTCLAVNSLNLAKTHALNGRIEISGPGQVPANS